MLSSLNGTNGLIINGIAAYGRAGTSVSSAGDINGDGRSDIVIGAPGDGSTYEYLGQTMYVVYGQDTFI
ncbi:MAG: integrin alpha [Candidatus Midichloria sp.]|uniref:FG-GAP repeat-containing protein n=1 Tax=Hyalomma marginatum TaxID=34627 RepID=A0A8S4C3S7_9ACAR|nr:FG-GAP repeat-containing protein [Hyalomma marginatum]CAG7592630.1 FG-GAP repeat-containing protein [Hyalomma marginatum]